MLSPSAEENKWVFPHSYGTIYGSEEPQAVLEAMMEGAQSNGKKVKLFEKKFAELVDGKYGVATNSWGSAAQIVAILMDLKETDEIIVPAWTMSASANFFVREGAKIVFAEVNPNTFTIDPDKLEEKITEHTKAICIVHMCGQPCDLDRIQSIAKKHNLLIIQDAAHAPGARYKGNGLGKYGDFVIYSFHQAKNMCTLGEGGMVVTNNKEWADKLGKLRMHGMGEYIGISCKMTEVQAAVGLEQIKKLPGQNAKRRELSYYLNSLLQDQDKLIVPYELPDVEHTYHLYSLKINKEKTSITKDEITRYLWTKKRIMAIAYYPTVNCLPVYKEMGHGEGECPITEEVAANTIVLPMNPRYTKEDMEILANGVKEVLETFG